MDLHGCQDADGFGDCKPSHLEVHCSVHILCDVDLPKAKEFSENHLAEVVISKPHR